MMLIYNVKVWFIVALVIYLGTGLAYSMVVPPFESPDELYHFGFARHIAQGNWLPVQSAEETGPWSHEGSQAPLYYLTAGWLTQTIDQSDLPELHPTNRRANLGNPLAPGNKNRMLYSARQTCLVNCNSTLDLPLQGTNLAMHIGRWLSLLLGALSLWLLHLTGQIVFPNHPRVQSLALLLMATLPQFAFISASVNNDNAIILAGSATLYWLTRLIAKRDSQSISWWEWGLLGVLLGLAALSKLQGLGLWLLAALIGVAIAWRTRDWRLPLRAALPVALPALLICGWWYWRNYTLYGDWIGATHLLDINGRRESFPNWAELVGELRGLRYSFWGIFGWFNILLPNLIYRLLDWVTVVSLAGLLASLVTYWRKPLISAAISPLESYTSQPLSIGQSEEEQSKTEQSKIGERESFPLLQSSANGIIVTLPMVLWASLSVVLILLWIRNATASQGRLLFPALTAFVLLLAAGWYQIVALLGRWLPKPVGQSLLLSFPALLLGCSIYALAWLLPNAYIAPSPVAELPAHAEPIMLRYVDAEQAPESLNLWAVDLAGIDRTEGRFHAGDRVPVTLYLSTDKPLANDYQLFIQLLDENGAEIANLTGHPGWGRNPTTLWQPGAIYPDPYQVKITGDIDSQSPLLARVYTGFIQPATAKDEKLPVDAFNESGEEILPIVSTVAIASSEPLDVNTLSLIPVGSEWGSAIRLVGYGPAEWPTNDGTAGNPLEVTLVWETLAQPAADYIAFLHMRTVAGEGKDVERIAGFDQPPAGNRFPTVHWQPGDKIMRRFSLPLPPNLPDDSYELWVGLYESGSGGSTLLPVSQAGAGFAEHNQVRIGVIQK